MSEPSPAGKGAATPSGSSDPTPSAHGRISPELIERAGLTRRQVQALELWACDPQAKSGGYGTVAMAMGLSKSSVQGLIQRGLRRLEQAGREAA